jgi:hypothetical protein
MLTFGVRVKIKVWLCQAASCIATFAQRRTCARVSFE